MFVYGLNGCVFEFCCSHLSFRYRACFERGLLVIQATTECRLTLKRVCENMMTCELGNIKDAVFFSPASLAISCSILEEKNVFMRAQSCCSNEAEFKEVWKFLII